MITAGGLRAVFLDMDDTLCDTEGITPRRLAAVRQVLSEDVEPALLDRVLGQAASWDPLEDKDLGRPPRLQLMRDALGLDDQQMGRMRARYNEVLFEDLALGANVMETLTWLRARVKLGLITSGPSEFQRDKIAVLGIGECFDSITISGEAGVPKPDPELFRIAMRSLNAEPHQSLYAGDRPKFDMEGSHAVGMTSVLVEKNYAYPLATSTAADFVIKSVTDLPRLILEHGWLSSTIHDMSRADNA